MVFKKIGEIGHSKGLTLMFCESLGDYLILYGGSNFSNGVPPKGTRLTYDDMYIYDKEFNLISTKKGKISPDSGILVKDKDVIYWISGAGNTKIYEYRIENGEILENEIVDINQEILRGYGCIFDNKIYFGNEYVYEYDIISKNITKKSKFPGNVRFQSIYFESNGYMYVLGGLSDICYLDSYKYDILNDKWEQIQDTPINLSGASFVKKSDGKVIITGGCNKEIYDYAVKNLHNIDYKIEYFSKSREEFGFNQKVFMFDPSTETYTVIGKGSIENATCGSSLIEFNNKIYLINGEVKPGYRTPDILEGV